MTTEYEAEDRAELAELVETLVSHRILSDPQIRQVDVAESMGIGQPSVSELERGETTPKVSTLQRYARAVGLKLKWELEVADSGDAES